MRAVLLLALAAISSAATPPMSLLVDKVTIDAITHTARNIKCEYATFHDGETTKTAETLTGEELHTLLNSHMHGVRTNVTLLKAFAKGGGSINVGVELPFIDEAFFADASKDEVNSKINIIGMKIYTSVDRACFELHAIRKRFDLFLHTGSMTGTNLNPYHTREYFEKHWGVIFALSSYDIMVTLNDKTKLIPWLSDQGLGDFIPSVYASRAVTTFPVTVMYPHKRHAEQYVHITDDAALDEALTGFHGKDHFLFKEIPADHDIYVHYIARYGTTIGIVVKICSSSSTVMLCRAAAAVRVEEIAPISSVVKAIVASGELNGFGCVRMRLGPGARAQQWIDRKMDILMGQSPPLSQVLVTDFQFVGSFPDASTLDSIPMVLDVMPHLTEQLLEPDTRPLFAEMVREYVWATLSLKLD